MYVRKQAVSVRPNPLPPLVAVLAGVEVVDAPALGPFVPEDLDTRETGASERVSEMGIACGILSVRGTPSSPPSAELEEYLP